MSSVTENIVLRLVWVRKREQQRNPGQGSRSPLARSCVLVRQPDIGRLRARTLQVAFGLDVDFATLHKIYGAASSFVERQNLTMRMSIRRFTRLKNAFSKKLENHALAVALHLLQYNFARIHKTLRVTPAMEAGIADHVWTLEEIAELPDGNRRTVA